MGQYTRVSWKSKSNIWVRGGGVDDVGKGGRINREKGARGKGKLL